MADKDFAECMNLMIKEQGKDILFNGKARTFIGDYRGSYNKEAGIFIKLLEAGCAKYINEADNVLERKRQLVSAWKTSSLFRLTFQRRCWI